jgi:hypothetical protein
LSQPIFDVSKLMASDDIATARHIWQVLWEAKLPLDAVADEDPICPDCGEVHDVEDLRIVADATTVLGGPEGQDAVDKVRAYITDPKSDFALSDFRLTGLHLLAEAEI